MPDVQPVRPGWRTRPQAGPAAWRHLPESRRENAAPAGYLRVLQLQELLLALQAAGVAGQLAGAGDDPVAGDQDAQRIAAHRGADLLGVLAAAQPTGEVAVGGGLPVGNLRDQLPDTELELRATGLKRQVEQGS